ncbi:hypothetical protein Glove_490g59 [Diversispora epigaea]|uniref:Coupling of ubiquitin conjugation to ER degradation protein 1 n=1 Tax=Diversispora epigaea TaxID=1348612 RepID=A0A397GKV4_9GLOM|nr:hypothetical protein Glove_490g59 [Diversispora epigaea]
MAMNDINDSISIFVAIIVIFCVFRWLLGTTPQQPTRARRTTSNTSRNRPRAVTPEMVETVCTMFPNIPPAAIQYDLQKTGSVEITCDNILQNGGLPLPPPAVIPTLGVPSTSQASSSSTSTDADSQRSLIDKYKLQEAVDRGFVPTDPPKKWEATPEKRQELLQLKKDAMVLMARERYLTQQKKASASKENETTSTVSTVSTSSLTGNNYSQINPDDESELRRRQILEATERRWSKEVNK